MGTMVEREVWHRYQCTAHVRLEDRHVTSVPCIYMPCHWKIFYRNLRQRVGKDPRCQDIKVMTSHDLKHENQCH